MRYLLETNVLASQPSMDKAFGDVLVGIHEQEESFSRLDPACDLLNEIIYKELIWGEVQLMMLNIAHMLLVYHLQAFAPRPAGTVCHHHPRSMQWRV